MFKGCTAPKDLRLSISTKEIGITAAAVPAGLLLDTWVPRVELAARAAEQY